jgi:hypothetical protein
MTSSGRLSRPWSGASCRATRSVTHSRYWGPGACRPHHVGVPGFSNRCVAAVTLGIPPGRVLTLRSLIDRLGRGSIASRSDNDELSVPVRAHNCAGPVYKSDGRCLSRAAARVFPLMAAGVPLSFAAKTRGWRCPSCFVGASGAERIRVGGSRQFDKEVYRYAWQPVGLKNAAAINRALGLVIGVVPGRPVVIVGISMMSGHMPRLQNGGPTSGSARSRGAGVGRPGSGKEAPMSRGSQWG